MTEHVSCVTRDTAYFSARSLTFENVSSLRVCQLACQTYSNPAVIHECAKKETSAVDICLAVSYRQVTGRCDLHFAIDGEFEIEGSDAAPVQCPDTPYVQTVSQAKELQADSELSACLSRNEVEIRQVQDLAKPAPKALPSPPSLPSLPVFQPSASSSSDPLWQANPDTPLALKGQIVTDRIFQIQQYVNPPPAGVTFFGTYQDVNDWRECALLCNYTSPCAHWSYLFNSATYATDKAACLLATTRSPLPRSCLIFEPSQARD